ncbi:hypothetical protein AUC61_23830 [Pseudomonas sp. S25]|uniref:Uncharacterized protein n=1 Tax=Pseudomonas maioricensis TaxID=1766623 RepID=A0ABS9ZPQ7_9PSED|nr:MULTISPECIES: hypothetical protein [Pseudomonas]MCD5980530.1 hypothetical protein [Pseudomonas quasicaspiana]MCI8212565.1 hypothetical protein [Pseudomonas sp. S25]
MTTAQLSAKMQQAADQLPTSRLIEAVRFLGGDLLPPAENMTRAALLTAYQNREGDDAVDALMDEIGL